MNEQPTQRADSARTDMCMWRIAADTGGTFTDVVGQAPDGRIAVLKILSNGSVRFRAEIRGRRLWLDRPLPVGGRFWLPFHCRRLADGYGCAIRDCGTGGEWIELEADPPASAGELWELVSPWTAPVTGARLLLAREGAGDAAFELRFATTRGTNALLEGSFPAPVLVTTAGFGDILAIDDQRRSELFSWQGPAVRACVDRVVELPVRIGGGEAPPAKIQCPDRFDPDRPVAVSFLGAWQAAASEQAVAEQLRASGVSSVTCGTDLSGEIGFVDRTRTAAISAGLQPVVDTFIEQIRSELPQVPLQIMASSGGLRAPSAFAARDSVLSGPAAGATGAGAWRRHLGIDRILTLDMGGTSTDVTRIERQPRRRDAVEVAGLRILGTAVAIETVAAGGGSVCWFDGVRLRVGPDSAGASPGPAAYGQGGPLTLTDVNLLRGRVDPVAFDLPLDLDASRSAAEALARTSGVPFDELLDGLLAIADERMAEAIRTVTVREGVDPRDYVLFAFGGAGGIHAAELATELGIREVVVPPCAGVLSAWGLLHAPLQLERVESLLLPVGDRARLRQAFVERRDALVRRLRALEPEGTVRVDATWFLRVRGQSFALPVEGEQVDDLDARFRGAYRELYGHEPPDAPVEVERLRLVALAERFDRQWAPTGPGTCVRGPARIAENGASIWVPTGWQAVSIGDGGWRLTMVTGALPRRRFADAVEVERFATRVSAIAEQMGEQLRRTALSVNVRERGDYSCAILDASGRLMANAPHIPVHLGALGACVRLLGDTVEWRPGISVLTNHPRWGGSHLPDLTVVTPVHVGQELIGFVASRAHHAEIGGLLPGSMPPDAGTLDEEGVPISPLVIEEDGRFLDERVRDVLSGHRWPSRRVSENIADIRAQLAANHRGRTLLLELGRQLEYGELARYASQLYELSAAHVRAALAGHVSAPLSACVPIEPRGCIAVRIEPADGGRFRVDFSGTSPVSAGNLNAPLAVTKSAVMFVLRTLTGSMLPLNEGLLEPVDLVVPASCLNPDFSGDPLPAVVGGNTELSQLVVAALIDALGVAAGAQGTMNNLVFGNAECSFYETLGGGCGATAARPGDSAVHSHMTNTALTDPEIFEHRYPARIEELSIRRGSGGAGRVRGGDGMRRVIRFDAAVRLALLTQRRTAGAPGRNGGGAGAPGRQWIEDQNGQVRPLGGIAAAPLAAGDRLVIETPGGGGWGSPETA